MKIIYSCYGGAHTSIVAAGIHLGLLPTKRVPKVREIMAIPYYDYTSSKCIGIPIYMGKDKDNHDIYVVGMGSARRELTQLVYDYVYHHNRYSIKEVLVVNSIALINLPVRIGGFISKKINIIAIGKPITAYGIQKNYMLFVDLVKNVKAVIDP
ncbi:DUF3189 family protein [Alkaliphilus peptidifermentans]|uniref:DUF3189 domain-containing protein n=1 Tax=Alkaliphilus peptidifermentans DSM 18978 TaxID=1120976 RepID=A0A1G5BBW5_9FIRM|nr:DUF3189 family protein [Alkaliphilus peptidifermentans]SCX87623.1 Protein of unknown function [Alkaliphilus peptidifermentans DSM 18978]